MADWFDAGAKQYIYVVNAEQWSETDVNEKKREKDVCVWGGISFQLWSTINQNEVKDCRYDFAFNRIIIYLTFTNCTLDVVAP